MSPGTRTGSAARCSAGCRVPTGETGRRSSPRRSTSWPPNTAAPATSRTFLVLDQIRGGPLVVTEVTARRGCAALLDGVALLSNGASRIVDPYGLTDWPGVLELLGAHGPAEVVRRVREAEAGIPDDATVAHCTWLRR